LPAGWFDFNLEEPNCPQWRGAKNYSMSRRKRKNVGVIGLGIIGSRVTDILRQKGFHVFVWNRTPQPVPNFVGQPAELAEMCDFVQLFVSDDDALLQVAEDLVPALAPRHIVLAHSTVSPHSMQRAAQIVESRGARFIEAPFTGSKTAAEKGELVYYVAGDDAALREARPILEASGKEVMVIGEIGQATVIKIATNMVTAASVQGAAEALALVRAAGLPMEKFVEAMRGNASHSATLALKLPKMIEANFEPHFSLKHMLKDVQIASRLGLSNQLELGVTAVARDRLLEQMQRGYGDDDYSAIARKYFADVQPAGGEEADLELFERPAAPEAFPGVEFHEEVLEPVQPDNFVPMMPEIGAEEPETTNDAIAPVPAIIQPAPVWEEPVPQGETNTAAAGEVSTPVAPHEDVQEEQTSRGFLGRLLGRGTG
jgi:3-hydroxyisobutyrate dehydrogenase-like beta-hydroxyacid dehydrogenase